MGAMILVLRHLVRRVRTAALFALALTATMFSSPAGVAAQDAYATLQQGLGLFHADKAAEALPYFDRALQLDPRMMNVYKYRGMARQDVRDLDGAVNDFTTYLNA